MAARECHKTALHSFDKALGDQITESECKVTGWLPVFHIYYNSTTNPILTVDLFTALLTLALPSI